MNENGVINNNQPQPSDVSIEPPKEEKKSKKNIIIKVIPVLVAILLITFFIYKINNDRQTIEQLQFKCSPESSYKTKKLDINSTIVQSLYKKVATTMREDLAQPDWDNTMKLYLAYRQLTDTDKYDSNCNYFDNQRMEPYTCEVSTNFSPKAFTVDSLELKWKELFGEETTMPLLNIKLKNSCIGGYQYIPERKEYVEGYCKQQTATSFHVTKKIVEATSSKNIIMITEDVKYYANEKMQLPNYLKSGTYVYTFKLDMNYNYILINKEYVDKYTLE